MNIKDLQNFAEKFVKEKHNNEYWEPSNQMLKITEEVGELAREINYVYGQKDRKIEDKKEDIGSEIADIIFVLICLSNSLEIDMEKSFKKMMEKYDN